jgi:hypothetical protein
MANSIADSEVVISSAVEVLDDLLAPIGNFALNVANDYSGRGSVVKVPLVDSSDTARVFNGSYESSADSSVNTVDITIEEIIKPFKLGNNELYKSPVNLSNYVQSNANAFGLFIMQKVKTAVETGGGSNGTKSASGFGLDDIKKMVKHLDSSGVPVNDRHLVISSVAHSNILPDSQDTYGTNAQVMQTGRVGQIYGLQVHPTSTFENSNGTNKCVAFASSRNGLAIVNRLPETQGISSLVKYETFTIPNLGLNCIYQEHLNTSSGELYGCFRTLFGAKKADINSISWVKGG